MKTYHSTCIFKGLCNIGYSPEISLKLKCREISFVHNICFSRPIVSKSCKEHCSNTVTWWRHQMETFFALLAICVGIHRSPVTSPHKGQWSGALIFSLTWTNSWANNGDAGDLRRYRAHYDVIVMVLCNTTLVSIVNWISQIRTNGHRTFLLNCYCPVYGAFDLGLAVSVPLPIVTGIFVLLWFQSRLT